MPLYEYGVPPCVLCVVEMRQSRALSIPSSCTLFLWLSFPLFVNLIYRKIREKEQSMWMANERVCVYVCTWAQAKATLGYIIAHIHSQPLYPIVQSIIENLWIAQASAQLGFSYANTEFHYRISSFFLFTRLLGCVNVSPSLSLFLSLSLCMYVWKYANLLIYFPVEFFFSLTSSSSSRNCNVRFQRVANESTYI